MTKSKMRVNIFYGIGLGILLSFGTTMLWAQTAAQLELLNSDLATKQAEYDALNQQINAEIQKAYNALQGADQGKDNKGKSEQAISQILQGISQMLQKVAPEAAQALAKIAEILQQMGQQDQGQAQQAQPPTNQGQQASADPVLQQQLATLQAQIDAIKAQKAALLSGSSTGTTSSTTDTTNQALSSTTLQNLYDFLTSSALQDALGINQTDSTARQAVQDIQNNVGTLADQVDSNPTSRSAVHAYQDKTHGSIDDLIGATTGTEKE